MSRPSTRSPALARARALLRDQRVAFLLVGAANLMIGLAWFAVVHLVLGDRIGYMATLVLAYALAILCAFSLHRRFVFRVRGRALLDLARFTLVQMGSLAVNAVMLPLMVEVVGMPVLPAQVVAIGVVIVFNYFGHLRFSFRRSSPPGEHR